MPLAIIQSCDGCGACCMHMAVPPFFGNDDAREQALPPRLKAELAAIWETRRVQFAATGSDHVPCAWFDLVTRKCRHWEHRPDACRDYTIGNRSCRSQRKAAGIQ